MNNPANLSATRHNHVAHLCFRNPPHNYVDTGLLRAIADQLELLDADSDCRAVVLSSEGKTFCAGADFSASTGELDPTAAYSQAMRLFRTRKPIVAAVQGAAIGAGLGLALVADFRVVAEEAYFTANFNRLGFHQGFGLSVTLPRLIGIQQAALMFFTGRKVDAHAALKAGLADDLVAIGELLPRALALAEEIAVSSPLAVQSTRETLRLGLADEVTEINRRECAIQKIQFKTPDFREGVQAAKERRLPDFTGR